MMKKLGLLSLLVLLTFSVALADVPATMNYQGRLTKQDGAALPDGNYDITFYLYDAATAGTYLWSESHQVSTKSGYFNVVLGSKTTLAGVDINTYHYLAIKVGTDSEMTPRQPLASVPFAIIAGNAITVNDSAVTNAKLAYHAVTADKMVDGAVINGKLADNAVTTAKIADGTVRGTDISTTANQRIGTTNIETSAIDSRTLADGAVNSQAKAPYAPEVYFNGTRTPNIKILTDQAGLMLQDMKKSIFQQTFLARRQKFFLRPVTTLI